MTPEDLERIFQSTAAAVPSADQEESEELAEEAIAARVAQLGPVLDCVKTLREQRADQVVLLAQKIGDGSRNESWRVPLGRSQVLEFFALLVEASGLEQPLQIHTLRIVGNCCADTDENRERVVASGECIPGIVRLISRGFLVDYAIPVLFNICVDYEPAQKAACQAGLNSALIGLIEGGAIAEKAALVSYCCKLLGLISGQDGTVHRDTVMTLLKLATSANSDGDAEAFEESASAAIGYLSKTQVLEGFVKTQDAVPTFFEVLEMVSEWFNRPDIEADDEASLKKLYSVFIQALSDLAASPTFGALHTLEGPEVGVLRKWVSSPNPRLQGAAYIALGNLARSDEACIHLVQSVAIHKPVIEALRDESKKDVQFLHAGLGFLKNLAISPLNRPALGEAGLLDNKILPRLWALQIQPQVQFAAISLTRLLLTSCADNVRRICNFEGSDANAEKATSTKLGRLIDAFNESDQEPTKMEAARAVMAVCRVLHSDSSQLPLGDDYQPGPDGSALDKFYETHPKLIGALVFLGSQAKFTALRSELWFVLALMTRSAEGAAVVAQLTEHFELVGPLLQAVAGKNLLEGHVIKEQKEDAATDGLTAGLMEEEPTPERQQVDPKQAASMSKADRENGLVLISELIKRVPQKINPTSRDIFQGLLKNGGALLANDTEAA